MCGSETGCLQVFQLDQEEEGGERHSIVKLARHEEPIANIRVSQKPIVHVDIGFRNENVLIFYQTSDRDLACVRIKSVLDKIVQ